MSENKRIAWGCKIGSRNGVTVPPGGDAPMRNAVENAFHQLTGEWPEATFSGWGETFDEGELAVIENRSPVYGVETSSFAHQVVEFNQRVLNIAQRPHGLLNQAELDISIKCLHEEIDEFKEAAEKGDFIGQVDAMIDLQYFAMGVLYKLGLTPDQIVACSTAVHEANMEKKLGVNAKRGDGSAADAVKPEGWESPEHRIGAILEN